jgi:hypothetical protein
MKKFLLALSIGVSAAVSAQTVDTIYCTPGFAARTYYRLSNKVQTPTPLSNWHLAIPVRASAFPNNPISGTSMRYNGGAGMKLYRVPGKTAADYNAALDTSGMSSWTNLTDPDTTWDIGAFNANKSSDIFNFGWGTYNQNSHDVVGDSMYLLKIYNSPGFFYKKFIIERLAYDTLWMFKWSNIDGTSPDSVTINKKDFAGKNFVYLNVLAKNVLDNEPLSSNWDLLFGRYATNVTLFSQTINDYPVVGTLSNIGVQVAEARGVDKTTAHNFTYRDSYTNNISEIGWDWKAALTSALVDSLSYFVKAKDNNIYKLIFTYYGGNANGKIAIAVQGLGTSIKKVNPYASSFAVYPNPASTTATLIFSNTVGDKQQTIRVYDMAGKQWITSTIESVSGLNTSEIDLSNLPKGLYIISLFAGDYPAQQRLLVK